MGNIVGLAGMAFAVYAGYAGFNWLSIFFSTFLMASGHAIVRAPQLANLSEDDSLAVPKIILINTTWMVIIAGPLYFLGQFLS
jgi:hypothetical protein